MRRSVYLVGSLVVLAEVSTVLFPQALAQTGRDEPDPPKAKVKTVAPPIDPAGTRMERLLELWARQSTRLTSLDVNIKQINKTAANVWGDEPQVFEGRAMFKSPNRAWIDFKKVVEDPKTKAKKPVHYERIICTGKEVWDYRSETREIYLYTLDRKDRDRAMQQGPLPFLFNFKAEDAKRRYRMSLIDEDKTSYVIGVLPLEQIDQGCFSKALIRLDRKFLLPTQIILFDPDGRGDRKSYELTDIKANHPVQDENFKGERLKGWAVRVNEDALPKEGGGAARRLTPRQPALGKGAPAGQVR